ncbi:MAG: hypothetical protein R2778_00910 [Saprospiraceae bacterium]
MNIFKTALPVFVLMSVWANLEAQVSGVVNDYAVITGFNCDSTVLTIDQSNNFSKDDLVLIIQMQGTQVSLANNATFGDVLDSGTAGIYCFNRLEEVGNGEVRLRFHLSRPFDVNGKLQLVRVPEYTDVATIGLTCKPWDGNTGGVLAIDVSGTLSLQGDIDASECGFRGGQHFDTDAAGDDETQYFYPVNPELSSQKGEGIAIIPADHSFGMGKAANGGGGGNAHNAGGGGGGNAGHGGNGGLEYFNIPNQQPTPNTNGLGGLDVFKDESSRIIMGGGGGAGHENDNQSVSGGNGGGIVFIKANAIEVNGFRVKSNGGDVLSPGTNRNDGQGGGGAGGTIVLSVNQLIGGMMTEVKGGKGGDCLFFVNSQIIGPGGGGGGGKIILNNALPNLVPNFTGGVSGIANQNMTNDAQPGLDGIMIVDALAVCYDTVPNFQNIDISLCPGESITINGELYTQAGTVSDTLTSSSGCDSITIYNISILPILSDSVTLEFCPGTFVTIGGVQYTQPGVVIDTLGGSNGCDSLVVYTLIQLAYATGSESIEFCPGSSVTIGGNVYSQSGTVTDTISIVGACDSIITYTLTQLPNPTDSVTIPFCPGSTVTINGVVYDQPE